jgi:CRP/FNR family transcriptional regulator
VPFWRGKRLGTQGEPCDLLYIIGRGEVLLTARSAEGEQPLYLLGRGDLFGEGALHPRHRWLANARAVSDGYANVLPAAQLTRVAQFYPHLVAHVLTLLTLRLERAHRRVDLLKERGARERLLGLLAVLAQDHGEPRAGRLWVPARLTQAELGGLVGLARETVARVLRDLATEGVVRRGRDGLWIYLELLQLERPP